jgi:double-strand break repair protein MRE11
MPEQLVFGETKELFITQPGSSVATSLCEAESVQKKVGLLTVSGKQFKMDEIPLKTVRPLIFKTVSLTENLDLSSGTEQSKQAKIDGYLKDYIEKLIETELPKKLTGKSLKLDF